MIVCLSRKYFSVSKEEIVKDQSDGEEEDDERFDEEGQPKKKRQKLTPSSKATDKVRKHDVTLLTPLMIREHLRKVWEQDAVLLKRLYSSLAASSEKNPVDIFFLDIVPVPPTKFRPVSWLLILDVVEAYWYCPQIIVGNWKKKNISQPKHML